MDVLNKNKIKQAGQVAGHVYGGRGWMAAMKLDRFLLSTSMAREGCKLAATILLISVCGEYAGAGSRAVPATEAVAVSISSTWPYKLRYPPNTSHVPLTPNTSTKSHQLFFLKRMPPARFLGVPPDPRSRFARWHTYTPYQVYGVYGVRSTKRAKRETGVWGGTPGGGGLKCEVPRVPP